MDRRKIGTYGLIAIFLFVLGGNMYGIYHDFSPEYEASVPIQYEMIVYDQNGNETILKDTGHGMVSHNYRISGNKVIPLTPLDAEGMKIQQEQGCTPCHDAK
jgi:hypothetical protein